MALTEQEKKTAVRLLGSHAATTVFHQVHVVALERLLKTTVGALARSRRSTSLIAVSAIVTIPIASTTVVASALRVVLLMLAGMMIFWGWIRMLLLVVTASTASKWWDPPLRSLGSSQRQRWRDIGIGIWMRWRTLESTSRSRDLPRSTTMIPFMTLYWSINRTMGREWPASCCRSPSIASVVQWMLRLRVLTLLLPVFAAASITAAVMTVLESIAVQSISFPPTVGTMRSSMGTILRTMIGWMMLIITTALD